MAIKRLVTGILASALLTACATPPSTTPDASQLTWVQHQKYVENINYWHAHGLMGIRQSREANSTTFDWRQCGKDYEIHLMGPFGAGAAVIAGNEQEVALTNNRNETFVAKTPEILLKQQTNLDVPISYLYYWLRGIPVPKIPAKMSFTPEHRLEYLVQNGWIVNYLNYDKVKGMDLPRKIKIEYPDLKIKVVIDHWVMNAC